MKKFLITGTIKSSVEREVIAENEKRAIRAILKEIRFITGRKNQDASDIRAVEIKSDLPSA